ncbi:hypothetical protein [Streptomyces sp. NPDC048659]|uniref:hypothetical protein n=1 Tax=Streptomyces sp. NPDC048659 TaxID=3155489 RepID=UPI00343E06B7
MTQRDTRTELERRAGAAARATEGVAFLRPNLAGLLRRLTVGASGRVAVRAPDGGRPVRGDGEAARDTAREMAREAAREAPHPGGVRAVRDAADGTWEVEILLTVRRGGGRARDVARAVRRAVEHAAEPILDEEGAPLGGRVRTTVVVTGIV